MSWSRDNIITNSHEFWQVPNLRLAFHTYINTHTHIHTHARTQTYVVPTYLPTYLPTYIHTYVHTYVRTYTSSSWDAMLSHLKRYMTHSLQGLKKCYQLLWIVANIYQFQWTSGKNKLNSSNLGGPKSTSMIYFHILWTFAYICSSQ